MDSIHFYFISLNLHGGINEKCLCTAITFVANESKMTRRLNVFAQEPPVH